MSDKSFKFKWWTPLGTTVQLIKSWKPKGCKTHGQYLKSLNEYLSQHLGDVNVIKEHGHGRSRGDIGLDGKVMVEIKVKFDSTSKFQRAVGQIEDYLEKEYMVAVVFCGRRDKNLVAQLKKKYEDAGPVWEECFEVVEKVE